MPELEGGPWFGLLAPAKTPRPIIDWLNAETRKAMAEPGIRAKLEALGVVLPLGSPEDFSKHIIAETRSAGATSSSAPASSCRDVGGLSESETHHAYHGIDGFAALNPSYRLREFQRRPRAPSSSRASLPCWAAAPVRRRLLMRDGGRPDFSAISRSCASMIALAGSSPSRPPSAVGGHPAVRPLGSVLIDDVEQHVFADVSGSGFAGHCCWSFLSLVAQTRLPSKARSPAGLAPGFQSFKPSFRPAADWPPPTCRSCDRPGRRT